MQLRTRIAVLVAAAVTVSLALAAVVVFLVERRELRAEVDSDLRERSAAVAAELLSSGEDSALRDAESGSLPAYAQVVWLDGTVVPLADPAARLPVGPHTVAVALGTAERFYADAEVAGAPVRVLTVPVPGGALQLAQPLREVHSQLLFLAGLLAAVMVGGVSIAALLGLLVARAALRPVGRLSAGAERVTATRDLSTRLDVRGHDELSRLAGTLNGMLESLEAAERSQRQLISDASHELRTPLASMRTNLEVLEEAGELPADERGRLVADVRAELEGLISTVEDLLDLAREGEQDHVFEELPLGGLVEESVAWAQRRSPGLLFRTELGHVVTRANRPLVQRAIGNLLDNAAAWSPPGAVVDVVLSSERLEVRDRGPGIAPEDLGLVFERFYRAPAARGRPGSGLGLAIVRQVADAHGWRVGAGNADDGGGRLQIEFTRSSPVLNQPSSRSHALAVDSSGIDAQPRPARRKLTRVARTGMVIMLAAPLLTVVGVSLLATEDQPPPLRTVRGTLERCADAQFCVDAATLDFGPPWYLGLAQARYDYDGDGHTGSLGAELAGMTGRPVTLETDGGVLDEDVYTINGLPLRAPDGELPAPQPTPSAGPSSDPGSGPDEALTGELGRCGDTFCLSGVELDLGPRWFVTTYPAAADLDGDGRACAVGTELAGLVGSQVTVEVGATGGPAEAEVYRIAGTPYRDPAGPAPWAGGPLRGDRNNRAAC